MNIHQVLKDTFGFNQFRGQQEEVIKSTIAGKDALVIMPTGGVNLYVSKFRPWY